MKKTTLLITLLLFGQLGVFAQDHKTPDAVLNTSLSTLHSNNPKADNFSVESVNSENKSNNDKLDNSTEASKLWDQDIFSMYPNPVRNTLYVTSNAQNASLEIYNVTGKLLFKKSIGFGKTPISVSDLKSGVYLVKFSSEANAITKKLIVN